MTFAIRYRQIRRENTARCESRDRNGHPCHHQYVLTQGDFNVWATTVPPGEAPVSLSDALARDGARQTPEGWCVYQSP